MGRHSNIILLNAEGKILDSIKHIDSEVNRVREIMRAGPIYHPAAGQNKTRNTGFDKFIAQSKAVIRSGVEKHLLNSIKGFSPLLCKEICFLAE
jgi:predicted ribosome quality control (RQC) complex YloA/Tae2 family protein